MDEFPFSALFLFAQSCLTDAVNVIFSDYCFTDTYLKPAGVFRRANRRARASDRVKLCLFTVPMYIADVLLQLLCPPLPKQPDHFKMLAVGVL